MITKNPMQLKAYIKEKAAEKHISAQLVMQNYMLERLLERISLSPYKHHQRRLSGFGYRWSGHTGHYGFGYDYQGLYTDP